MENASKALIIAGAILLSILIISLGIIIYRQAAGVVENNQMEELEIQTFNSKFTQYVGENVRASVVSTLLDTVAASNAKSNSKVTVKYYNNTDKQVPNASFPGELTMNTMKNSTAFTVKVGYDANGYINIVNIYGNE